MSSQRAIPIMIVCVGVGVCVYVHMYMQVCRCVWGPEVNDRSSSITFHHLICKRWQWLYLCVCVFACTGAMVQVGYQRTTYRSQFSPSICFSGLMASAFILTEPSQCPTIDTCSMISTLLWDRPCTFWSSWIHMPNPFVNVEINQHLSYKICASKQPFGAFHGELPDRFLPIFQSHTCQNIYSSN